MSWSLFPILYAIEQKLISTRALTHNQREFTSGIKDHLPKEPKDNMITGGSTDWLTENIDLIKPLLFILISTQESFNIRTDNDKWFLAFDNNVSVISSFLALESLVIAWLLVVNISLNWLLEEKVL